MLKQYDDEALVILKGKIVQVIEDTELMIMTKGDEDLGYDDYRVLVNFASKPQVIEGDIVTVYARYEGTQKYKTVLGAEAEVPLLRGDFLGISKAK